ncbi:glyoxalase [Halolactibacillus alkaliphilus]|uniref:Glyoxalase n=1 Tax=Halolactibacillus alkaliphilus TaxID=442899 RepID=A0A511WXC2_9BACI|nr:VOC family protein [Halolactibacillus alkaliphilus]GEN55597.1 glyoxalase [Halolactibacillus alkaliphilus]GGN63841.1 glyoxalase [Halolactibacillus alkaliphilus]SFO62353.1 catechol 2,3-dioxygenase [Halolactibacillus alkaliphilus]
MGCHEKPTTFVSDVSLKVSDLQRSLTFYQTVIGFKVLSQTNTTAELTADGHTVLLTLIQPKDVTPKHQQTTGMYHFALLLPEKKDLADMIVHLSRHNIDIGAADHLVSEAIYLSDLDGNEIEVYVDRDPAEWTWNDNQVKMATEPLNIESLMTHRIEGSEWQGLPEETIMGHIHLYVADLNQTKAFYVEGLGLDVASVFGSNALFLSSGHYHHHVGINTWKGEGLPPEKQSSVGMQSFKMVYSDSVVLNEVVTRLKKQGVIVDEIDQRLFTKDPSGNRIELTI